MGSVNKWVDQLSKYKQGQLASVVAGVRYHLDKSSNWNRMITKLVHPFFLARQLATM